MRSLSKFQGSWRRFDVFDFPDFVLIDDYAHHPTEIEVTLKAIREKYEVERVCCIYQPHQYQRTQFLFDGFIKVFKKALDNNWIDKLVLLDVYDVVGREGNEEIKKNFNSEVLAQRIGDSRCIYWKNNDKIKELFVDFDVFVMMGAGSIYDFSQKIKKKFGYCCI
jgi:UDP-N-acetylmuramate--alanine ligase